MRPLAHESSTECSVTKGGQSVLSGNIDATINGVGSSLGSPVTAVHYMFVSTTAGLRAYDFDLNFLSSVPLPGGISSPAVNANGDVLVATSDGYFYRLQGKR